jgi:hypothetical protein
MKKWMKTGIFAVLFIVMFFMSGWISPVSTNTAMVAPPTTQIVYDSVLINPIPTPTTPIPARTTLTTIPTTPTTIPTMPTTRPATSTTIPTIFWATNDNGNDESTYNYNYLKPTLSVDGVTGSLIIRFEGCSADGLTVFIARNGTNVSPIDNNYLLYQMVAGDQNTVFLPVKILPDGNSETVKLAPGYYTAYLPDKSGDEIEDQQSFMIGAHVMSYVSLSGSSYRSPNSSGCPGCSCSRSR